jgi:hypothetical protein
MNNIDRLFIFLSAVLAVVLFYCVAVIFLT